MSFQDKIREKQLKYERTMMKEISLKEIKKSVDSCFGHHFHIGLLNKGRIEEGCMDFAVESFLIGAKYSKFGCSGEALVDVQNRSRLEDKALLDEMYEYLLNWGQKEEYMLANESIYIASGHFLNIWWKEGYLRGMKRRKLRLN